MYNVVKRKRETKGTDETRERERERDRGKRKEEGALKRTIGRTHGWKRVRVRCAIKQDGSNFHASHTASKYFLK